MVMDKKNYYQETAAQLRQKIKQFKKRPAYLVKFMKACGKLESPAADPPVAAEVWLWCCETKHFLCWINYVRTLFPLGFIELF